MVENEHTSILRRMLGQQTQDVAQSPLTSSRAVRMALTKAAHDSVGLVAAVKSVDEVVLPLEEMLAGLTTGLMLIALHRNEQMAGLIAMDMQMRAAVAEMQTVGQLSDKAAEDRSATGTDKRMCDPLLRAFLTALPNAVMGTEFEGWLDGVSHHEIVPTVRNAGLVLDDREYRILSLTVDLGTAGRSGQIILVLPISILAGPPSIEVREDVDWATVFHAAVSAAPMTLNAELHRFTVPLSLADSLQVGETLALPGCTVSSVRLRASDGQLVRHAKLGQVGGKRAIRIEPETLPAMSELAAVGGVLMKQEAEAVVSPEPRASGLTDAPTGDMIGSDVGVHQAQSETGTQIS